MKKFIIISTAFLLSFLSNINAQEVAPLQLGNIWVYDTGTTLVKVTVTDTNAVIDTIVYNKLESLSNYGFFSNGYSRLQEDGYYAMRRDTSYPVLNHELLYYKKNSVIGDTWIQPDPWSPFNAVYTIEDTFVINVFGKITTVKYLRIDSGILLFEEFWTEKYGKLSRSDFGGPLESLQGCIIDGIVYGDTTFTVVSVEDEFDIPQNFYLKQNFPNPFNSSTIIEYELPGELFITLSIYNTLGEKVETLINGIEEKGIHKILFNSNQLVSGIYFYSLSTPDHTVIKKMILQK